MKVIRKRRVYHSRRRQRIKRIAVRSSIAILCVLLAGAAFVYHDVLGGVFVKDNNTASTEEPTTSRCIVENKKTSTLDLLAGEISILSVTADRDTMDKITFKTSDKSVLSVDSGGRIDAKNAGSATVTVSGNGFLGKCNVTVSKKESDKTTGVLTTSYTANAEILQKNLKDKKTPPYQITVNRRTNTVTVYTYDDNKNYTVPVRAMICSCGSGGKDETPVGEFSVYFKNKWHALFGNCYGQYVTGFNHDILFHSVPYYKTSPNQLESDEFNKLGDNVSQGCVRLMVADAKWIYDNCQLKTVVNVIDDSSAKDPLGTPPTIKINEKVLWDPTDPDKSNPYAKKVPKIKGAVDMSIISGGSYNPANGVSAYDTCSNDITDKMSITGNVIPSKPGAYLVTYRASDVFGRTAEKTITITVEKAQ